VPSYENDVAPIVEQRCASCHYPGNAQSGDVSEGDDASSMTATGTIASTDVDLSDGHTYSVSVDAAHGTAGVDADTGAWTYTVSDTGAVDALAVGEHLADSFTVQVADGNGGFATQVRPGRLWHRPLTKFERRQCHERAQDT